MNLWLKIGLIAVASIITLFVLIASVRRGKPIRTLLKGGVQGIGAITAVNVASLFSGVSLGYGWMSLAVSAVLGIPGVITLLVLKVIFALN